MAQENVEFNYRNFCIGPINGTFCSIDTTNPTAILSTKNNTGGTVGTQYPLNPTIAQGTTVRSIEYTGPRYLNALEIGDGLPFFTLEHDSSSQCTIKQWRLDTINGELDLYNTIVKSNTGSYRFNCYDMAVESYRTTFASSTTSGTGVIELDDVTELEAGDSLLLGPSSDTDNEYAYEYVTVTSISGSNVYITTSGVTPPIYEYVSGDATSYYKNIYLFSDTGRNGSSIQGSMYRLDPDTGTVLEVQDHGAFSGVRAAAWSPTYQAVSIVKGTNLAYWQKGASGDYQIIRSQALTNIEDDDVTVITVYDLAFDVNAVYRLQLKKTMVDDDGNKTTYDWSTYNYHQDTINPYTKSVVISTDPDGIVLNDESVTLNVTVRDQFGVVLNGILVDFDKTSGDSSGYFTPLNGQVYTNASGIASVLYTTGYYDPFTGGDDTEDIVIKATADGASSMTGSEYVVDGLEMLFLRKMTTNLYSLTQKPTLSGSWPTEGSELYSQMYLEQWNDEDEMQIDTYIRSLSKFQFPGGHWTESGAPSDDATTIIQLESFTSDQYITQIEPEVTAQVYIEQLKQKYNDLQVSQTYVSRHVLGDESDTVEIDQFRFIEDAIPGFFSYKNPVGTNIWIRLRPFAFSLDQSTLVFKVREISYAGDTGYVDVTSSCSVFTFDAGGGLLGLDITYNPPNDFHHNAIVYVSIVVYDMAPTPNVILTDYWFRIIPDYRAPYIENESPERGEEDVSVSTNISFDILDAGVGVDLSTLEFYVNNRIVTPLTSPIAGGYHVSYNPSSNFYYGQTCEITVKVRDGSDNANLLYDMWRFYCEGSTGPWIDSDSFYPRNCSKGMPRKVKDISFNVYGIDGTGVDRESIMVTIGGKTRDVKIIPIVYRID